MSADTETLKQAIATLYAPTSSEQQRAQANQWLMTFSSSAAAWEASRALLAESDENIRYFGANLLFMKVRSEWHGLAEDMKASIYQVVGGLVTQLAVPPPPGQPWARLSAAGRRLCLVLAAAAVRSNALEAFTTEALKMANDPSGAATPVGRPPQAAPPAPCPPLPTSRARARSRGCPRRAPSYGPSCRRWWSCS